ncbi:affinity nitrate transporter 2 [Seminavis robusta]|uniref:Nitrate/nitrite transporter n=1 Tax=Seminavis robusta TaxID=568900 RepID=A0A9N8HSM8_9STRA|nr:affinity nitrate transporter 2 [Seminavis robusta]|eukprot:Sro1464_g274890.1 affinity nitrate transporter 2 (492) ;mRNA; f:13149-14814
MSSEIPAGEGYEWKKYSEYQVEVDPDQDDKAKEIKLCSFARPHMRAFHLSWGGFFIAFFIWFAIAPLLSEIKKTLGLTKQEIWTSSIVGVGGTIMMRFVNGPLCDKFGARIPYTIILCFASIPCALTGTVNSAATLAVLRLFIGFGGSTFVMCQYWASRMFAREVVGTANALCGGWGNLGGGVTQLVMGSMLFPLFKEIFKNSEDPAEKAWRTVCIIPAVVGFAFGVGIYYLGDDAPKGNYDELKKHGVMAEVSAGASFRAGALNVNTWLLFIQYACCFGVELTMNNAAALYFKDEFGQSTESAAAIASIFGWMNLFARGLGGWASDKANGKMGMRGRLIVHTVCLLLEGILVIVFANTGSLGLAIVVMVFFSLFVQAAEGTSYGIVPYVDPPSTGSIAGIVGAGGNTGAVCFGLGFRNLEYFDAFILMGSVIIISSVLSGAIYIKGHSALFCGKDEVVETSKGGAAGDGILAVPEPDSEKFVEVEEEIDC